MPSKSPTDNPTTRKPTIFGETRSPTTVIPTQPTSIPTNNPTSVKTCIVAPNSQTDNPTVDCAVTVELTNDPRSINTITSQNEWTLNQNLNNPLSDWGLKATLDAQQYGFKSGLSILSIEIDGYPVSTESDVFFAFSIGDDQYVTFVTDLDGTYSSSGLVGIFIYPPCGSNNVAFGDAETLISSTGNVDQYVMRDILADGNRNNWGILTTTPNDYTGPVIFEFTNNYIDDTFTVNFRSATFPNGLSCAYNSAVSLKKDFKVFISPDVDSAGETYNVRVFYIAGTNTGYTLTPTNDPTPSPTNMPSKNPTNHPTTPTSIQTAAPTPTPIPTATTQPTVTPTKIPTPSEISVQLMCNDCTTLSGWIGVGSYYTLTSGGPCPDTPAPSPCLYIGYDGSSIEWSSGQNMIGYTSFYFEFAGDAWSGGPGDHCYLEYRFDNVGSWIIINDMDGVEDQPQLFVTNSAPVTGNLLNFRYRSNAVVDSTFYCGIDDICVWGITTSDTVICTDTFVSNWKETELVDLLSNTLFKNYWQGYTTMLMGDGNVYDQFLVMQPSSTLFGYVTYNLHFKYTSFSAVIGLAGFTSSTCLASYGTSYSTYDGIIFEFYVDNVLKYTSNQLIYASDFENVNI
eukprot:363817_1